MRSPRTARAFTLLELTLVMLIFAVIGAVVTPVIIAATDSYASARSLRSRTENAAFALDRVRRIIREAPRGSATRLDVAESGTDVLVFTDDTGVRLNGTTLELVTPAGTAPLARAVSAFVLSPLAPDGVTPIAPDDAHLFDFSLTIDGVTLTGAALPRVNLVGDS